MNWNRIISWTWRRYLVAILIIAGASAIRAVFFGGLGRGTAYLTYYPATLLDGIDGREALLMAERLRAAVEAKPFEQKDRVFPLTQSIGLIKIEGPLASGELMSQADVAMYRAKAQGKNRVNAA